MKFSSENLDPLCRALKLRLRQPLPGETAHMKMASRVRKKEIDFNFNRSEAVKSAVLILLYPASGAIRTVFILRPDYKGVHARQVAFPGGRVEASDKSIEETALREANEEVNIEPGHVKLLGNLSDLYIPPSNYLVTPVVGYTENVPEFVPEKSEVDKIIEADLANIFDETLINHKIINVRGIEIEAPYFDINGYVVWGATAMILSELKEVISSINPNS